MRVPQRSRAQNDGTERRTDRPSDRATSADMATVQTELAASIGRRHAAANGAALGDARPDITVLSTMLSEGPEAA